LNQGALWQVKHGKWCPLRGFDALPRDHPRPDFQSIQYLSWSAPVSQRPILDNSLDNSPGPRIVDRFSRFKLRGSHLVDAGSGLLGMVAESGSNWVEGVGRRFGGICGSDLGRVMDGWRLWGVFLFGGGRKISCHSADSIICACDILSADGVQNHLKLSNVKCVKINLGGWLH